MKYGTHPIYRKLLDHWIWTDKPFARGQAWVDLILRTNYQDNDIIRDSNKIEIKEGQLLTSLSTFSTTWGWSRTKVVQFLKLLKKEQMIDYKSTSNFTIITLLNYIILKKDLEKFYENLYKKENE